MDIASLTDQDIEDLCRGKPYGDKMRDDLRAQRFAARERAYYEPFWMEIEEEMTDANKADDFPPHASPFPTKAQLLNAREPRMVGLSIAVSADKMSGKTSLLIMILDMLADAGALSVEDTRYITNNIGDFFHTKWCINDELVEVLDLDLDLNVLYEMSLRAGR
jgi:hypothetical protein